MKTDKKFENLSIGQKIRIFYPESGYRAEGIIANKSRDKLVLTHTDIFDKDDNHIDYNEEYFLKSYESFEIN